MSCTESRLCWLDSKLLLSVGERTKVVFLSSVYTGHLTFAVVAVLSTFTPTLAAFEVEVIHCCGFARALRMVPRAKPARLALAHTTMLLLTTPVVLCRMGYYIDLVTAQTVAHTVAHTSSRSFESRRLLLLLAGKSVGTLSSPDIYRMDSD